MKKGLILSLLSLALFIAGCGGDGGGDDGDDNLSLNGISAQGTWLAGDVTFTGEGNSGTLPDFRIQIDGDQISASADGENAGEDDWWHWGPATYTQAGNNIVVASIPEIDGGNSVLLSLNLTVQSETSLTGTASIDWFIPEQNAYWHSEGPVTATKQE